MLGALEEEIMAGTPPNLPPQAVMMQLVNGMVVSRCIALAAELGIADRLADGAKDVAALASPSGMDADALYRVLRTLCGLGIFVEQPGRVFANSPLSEVLRGDAPGSVRDLARWLGHPLHWGVIGDLDYSVRTGQPALAKDHPGKSPFQVIAEDAGAQAVFNAAMTSLSMADGAAIVRTYDFSRFARIIDVGGGQGTLAAAIARAVPAAQVTVFDLPHVVEGAREALRGAGVADRVQLAGGSFFDGVPGPADLCVLKYVLHLCDDTAATRILHNCRAALEGAGTVLVCEMLITPTPDSMPARVMDIEMLAGPGGRERTEAEFAALFGAAGLKLERVLPTPFPIRLLEATVRA